ncbi:MAG: glutathione S-transferase family protein [Rhizorhabdus sp.]
MKLFDADWAPSPRRVRIFLAEKGISVERVLIDIKGGEHLGSDYVGINPQRQMPALLLDDGTLIDDSLGICRYFEAIQPDPPLFGRTAVEIGLVESWLRRIEHDCFQAVAAAFRNRGGFFATRAISGEWPPIAQIPAMVERGRTMWIAFADVLDSHLQEKRFIAGADFSMADIAALVAIDFGITTHLPDPLEKRPALATWHAAMSARPTSSA